MIEQIKSFGFEVWARPNDNGRSITWCYFTDGINIGYIQWGEFCRH